MNTNKIDLIKAEVVRLKSNLIHGACSSQIAMETCCKEEAYNEVLAILDTMREEPVSKVWHDVEENPDENRDFAFVDYDGVMWSRYRIEDLCHDWQSYVNMTGMTKWAYTSDLIKL